MGGLLIWILHCLSKPFLTYYFGLINVHKPSFLTTEMNILTARTQILVAFDGLSWSLAHAPLGGGHVSPKATNEPRLRWFASPERSVGKNGAVERMEEAAKLERTPLRMKLNWRNGMR